MFGDVWREHEEEAIYMGLNLDYYWSLNPKQYKKHQEAYQRRIDDEIKRQDLLNYALGRYISFAFHEPNKYPRKPFTSTNVESVQQTAEQMEQAAMIITTTLGGTINGRQNNS